MAKSQGQEISRQDAGTAGLGSGPLFLRFCLAAAVFGMPLIVGPAAYSQEPPRVSTAAAAEGPEASPLILTLTKDRGDSSVRLDYSVRWDFSDLAGFRPGFRMLVDGLSALGKWDITENTRVKYYGVRTNPWRMFISRERVKPPGTSAPGPQVAASGENSPEYRKRLRLSLSPLVDDLKRGLDDDLRRALLENSLKSVSPDWERASTRDRKLFFRDLLSLELWDLPVLSATKGGLEYISR